MRCHGEGLATHCGAQDGSSAEPGPAPSLAGRADAPLGAGSRPNSVLWPLRLVHSAAQVATASKGGLIELSETPAPAPARPGPLPSLILNPEHLLVLLFFTHLPG